MSNNNKSSNNSQDLTEPITYGRNYSYDYDLTEPVITSENDRDYDQDPLDAEEAFIDEFD